MKPEQAVDVRTAIVADGGATAVCWTREPDSGRMRDLVDVLCPKAAEVAHGAA